MDKDSEHERECGRLSGFIIDAVDHVASRAISPNSTQEDVNELMKPVKYLRQMLRVPKRRLTIRRR